jgi:hypothetical protein
MRAFAVVFVVVLSAGLSSATGEPTVFTQKLRVSPSGAVVLKLEFDPQMVPPGFDPWADGFLVTLDGMPVVTATRERGRFDAGPGFRYTYREKGDTPCRVRLDLGMGTLRVKGKVPALAVLSAESSVTVAVTLGGEVASSDVRPKVKRGTVRYRDGRKSPIGRRLAFRTLASGEMGSWHGGVRVARTAEEYDALWREVRRTGDGEPPPAPAVDFDTEMVVGVLLGSRPSSGYSVEVLAAKERVDGGHVEYRETRPAGACIVLTVVTAPWTLVAMPVRHASVSARVHVRTIHCGSR